MKNLGKIIVFVCAIPFCYAQQIEIKHPSIITIEKDTLVCFTLEQTKQMIIWNENRKECVELRNIDNQKITELLNITGTQTSIITNLDNIIAQLKNNFEDKNSLLLICEDEKKTLKDELKKQKRAKWIAIISGLGGMIITTFILVK